MSEPPKSDLADSSTESERDSPKRRKTSESRKVRGEASTSRYGRARKPKISQDFCDIDDVLKQPPNAGSPKRHNRPPETGATTPEDTAMKIVSNDAPDSTPNTPKTVKTYGNRKKTQSPGYESFGLPDNVSQVFLNGNDSKSDDSEAEATNRPPNKTSKKHTKDSKLAKVNYSKRIRNKNGDGSDVPRRLKPKNKIVFNKVAHYKTKKFADKFKKRAHPKTAKPARDSPVANDDKSRFKVGDLVWTRIGGHPFWPSMVTNEPGTQSCVKNKYVGRGMKTMFHVNFFGDNGRRSWAFDQHIMMFRKRTDLKVMLGDRLADNKQKDPKQLSAFIINPKKQTKWNNAVSEAESLLAIEGDLRPETFFDLFIPSPAIKRSPPTTPDIKQKPKKKKLKGEPSPPSDVDNRQAASDSEEPALKSPKIKDDAVKKPKVEVVPEDPVKEEPKPEAVASGDDAAQHPKKKKARLDKPAEEPLDNEKLQKMDSPPPNYLPLTILKQKRNVLFRGVSKDRVCQICGKPNEVLRCKGVCNGLFHAECDEKANKVGADCKASDSLPESSRATPESQETKESAKSDDADKPISSLHSDPDLMACLVDEKPATDDILELHSQCANIVHKIAKISNIEADYMPNFNADGDDSTDTEGADTKAGDTLALNNNVTPEPPKPNVPNRTRTTKDFYGNSPPKAPNSEVLIKPRPQRIIEEEAMPGEVAQPALINERSLSLAEQIDRKMFEVMESLMSDTKYAESTTSESESDDASESTSYLDEAGKRVVRHITADSVYEVVDMPVQVEHRCIRCQNGVTPACFVCGGDEGRRQRCSITQCGKFYHPKCLRTWPQTKYSSAHTKGRKYDDDYESLMCPHHVCHTCTSDNPHEPLSRCANEKLAKCIRCPTTYHISSYCVPAGTQILSTYQILCPKHATPGKTLLKKINAAWCFICAIGGSLICCEMCPASFHVDCLKMDAPEGSFICEECENGRLPLYNEIIWVKLGNYRWWPAHVSFPEDVPENILALPHSHGEFAVRFFGSHDHHWVDRSRVFLFQEGDSGQVSGKKNSVDGMFVKAIEEATDAHALLQELKANRKAELRLGLKPPPYVKIKSNRPFGNVRQMDANISNTTPCDCDPGSSAPCAPETDCLNRILMTECNPVLCNAGDRCHNQQFEKRLYSPVEPFKTSHRGWGLRTLAPIRKGQFVIEYIGELIDEREYQRRIQRKHELKDENYYFLTIDKDRMIDAGPKGNVARFMNHSCQPNCETQKWNVNGDTRVGLFAICDIPSGDELTFNYNLECIGKEKKICKCGAPNCSGYIGGKIVKEENGKKRKLSIKNKKKKSADVVKTAKSTVCFVCDEPDAVVACDKDNCSKTYHLKCAKLEFAPDAKWLCPWHSCNVCTKRTIRSCYKCTNSYCPLHSENMISYDRAHGFICHEHKDVKSENPSPTTTDAVENSNGSSPSNVTEDEAKSEPETKVTTRRSLRKRSPEPAPAKSTEPSPIKRLMLRVKPDSEINTSDSEGSLAEYSHIVSPGESPVSAQIDADCRQDANGETLGFYGAPTRFASEAPKRKRGRPRKFAETVAILGARKKLGRPRKHPKVPENPEDLNRLYKSQISDEQDSGTPFEPVKDVRLSTNIPERHLRTMLRKNSDADNKIDSKFIQMQNDIEKDLPIRKRSKLRYETQ